MKLLFKYFFVDIEKKKAIPPAEMIGQNQNRGVRFNLYLIKLKCRKVFFDYKLNVPGEKVKNQAIFSGMVHVGKLQKNEVNCKFSQLISDEIAPLVHPRYKRGRLSIIIPSSILPLPFYIRP